MNKTFKYKNNLFLDSIGIMHNKRLLSEILEELKNSNKTTEINIVTGGEPVKCDYKIDGKDVYVQRVNFTTSTSWKTIATLPNAFEFVGIRGYVYLGEHQYTLPYNEGSSYVTFTMNDYTKELMVKSNSTFANAPADADIFFSVQ